MKIPVVIVLLLSVTVTLNVVYAISCYDCVNECNDPKEIDCPNADRCISVTMTPDSKYQSVKTCVVSKHSKDLCATAEDENGKCYICSEDLCNKDEYYTP